MRYLFAGGGTGGHLCPGLALAAKLEELDSEARILFVGTENGLDRELVPASGYELKVIAAGRGSPFSLRRPGNFPRFTFALGQSLKLIGYYKPDVIIALGGFAAAAPGIAGRMRGVPIVILEQNTVPGRVNRLLSMWSKRAYLQFPEARELLRKTLSIKTPGSPVRPEIAGLFERENTGDSLLILGGSQGAVSLNNVVTAAAPDIVKDCGCPIIHVAGEANEADVRQAYSDARVRAEVLGFTSDMASCLKRARLCISRAGALSCAELALAKVPAVLIPLPSAMDDHQRKNAESIVSVGGAVLLDQNITTPELLAETVSSMWPEEKRLAAMSSAIASTARPGAAEEIARDIISMFQDGE